MSGGSEERQRGVALFNAVWTLIESRAGHAEDAASWRDRARAAGDAIADPEDREQFDRDFATL